MPKAVSYPKLGNAVQAGLFSGCFAGKPDLSICPADLIHLHMTGRDRAKEQA